MTPKWILWRVITTSWKFLSRRIFLKRKFYLITGRFSQNRRVVRPRRTNDKARFVLCFIANYFISGTNINGDGVTQFQLNHVNPCLMLTMPTRSFRKSYTWWETHNYASATLMQHWCNFDATLMQSLQNMKNVSMMAQMSQLQHMSATQQRMISRFTVADDLKSSSKITSQRTISEDHQRIKVKPPWRINDYELTHPRNAKDNRIQ